MTYNLRELFNNVWDTIEAGGTEAKRPEVSGSNVTDVQYTTGLPHERFPVLKYFETSLVAAEQGALGHLAVLLQHAAEALVWSQNPSYSAENAGARFMQNYVFGQIAGPGAVFATDAPPSGFLLMGPHTEYPIHSHVPAEVYLVLTPNSRWQLDGQDWFGVSPGDIVYHTPYQPHAMRTAAAPLLAYGAWLDVGNRGAISI